MQGGYLNVTDVLGRNRQAQQLAGTTHSDERPFAVVSRLIF
jgi:hypothetical protein